MTKQEIQIGNRTLPVVFNMATLLKFEELSDRPFFGEEFERNQERIYLIYSAIYTADKNTDFTIDDLTENIQWQQVVEAFHTITTMATSFLSVPKVVEDAEKQEADTSDDADAKN